MTTTNLIERLFEESQDNPDNDRWKAAFALEAQAKRIADLEKLSNEWFDAYDKKRVQLEAQAKQIEALRSEVHNAYSAGYSEAIRKGNV